MSNTFDLFVSAPCKTSCLVSVVLVNPTFLNSSLSRFYFKHVLLNYRLVNGAATKIFRLVWLLRWVKPLWKFSAVYLISDLFL